jgi:tripartite ATP-independent transporter DctM subunit
MSLIANYLPLWMFLALMALLFTGLPVAIVLGGVGLLFGYVGVELEVIRAAQFLSIMPRIWGGIAADVILVAIPLFILMGSILEKSGIAEDLLECLKVLLHRVPGAMALAVTLMGTIMAATTGIIGASIVVLSLIALPTMLANNYSKELATGTIGAAGCLGVLIPPSIMLVVMGEIMQVPVGVLFAGALFPGLLLSSLYVVYILVLCTMRPHLAPRAKIAEVPESWAAYAALILRGFVPALGLIAFVLGSIYTGWATPTEAAGVGCAGAAALGIMKGRLRLPVLSEVLVQSALTNAMVFMIFIGATVFSYVFRITGGDELIIGFFRNLGLGSWGILIVLMALIFLLGIPFEWPEITLIVLPVFYPVLQVLDFGTHLQSAAEIMPWFVILCAVNLQTSFLTPPYGFALFYLKGTVPPSVTIAHIYRGVWPFVGLQLVCLILCLIFPAIVLWLPRSAGMF